MRGMWSAAAGATLIAAAAAVYAQGGDAHKAAAVALFNDAETLMASGNFAAACPKYAESNRLDPQLGALVHLADCYEKNGQLASAWASWNDAVEIARVRSDSRLAIATQRAAALEPRLAKFVLEVPSESDVPGLEIHRDGALVSRGLWGTPVPVDKGDHTVKTSAPGRKTAVVTVKVDKDGILVKHRVGLLEALASTSASAAPPAKSAAPASSAPSVASTPPRQPVPTPDSSPDRGDPGKTQRTLGWITAGVGVVGLGVGLFFDLNRRSKENDRSAICPTNENCTAADVAGIQDLNDQVSRASKAEIVSFAIGGAALVGGLVLVLSSPPAHRRADSTASRRDGNLFTSLLLSPYVGRNGSGLTATARW